MNYFPYTSVFGNFNCSSTTKAKDLINFPSSLQVFALTPDIPIVRTMRNRNKDLNMDIQMRKFFTKNGLFVLHQSFTVPSVDELYYNFTMTIY